MIEISGLRAFLLAVRYYMEYNSKVIRMEGDMTMKRYIVFIVSIIMIVTFVGCNSFVVEHSNETTTTTIFTETTEAIQTSEVIQTTETTQNVSELVVETKKNRANTINYLQVISCVKNDRNIYKIRYPECYYSLHKDDMVCEKIELTNPIDTKAVSDEDFEYIIKYIDSIPSYLDEDLTGYESFVIYISYYDEEGDLQNKSVNGYSQLPDGWAEFIDCVNYLCGDSYLCGEGEVIGVTPEFLTEIFGLVDENLVSGTVEELIEINQLGMDDIASEDFDMFEQIGLYYDSKIQKYLSFEVKSVDSTKEEYDAFVDALLNELGEDWREGNGGDGRFRYLADMSYTELFIGKTEDLSSMNIRGYDGVYDKKIYCIEMIDGEFVCYYPFIYSKDGKFLLIDWTGNFEENREIYMKFIELEADK